jgi:flagellar basal-body rod protein FlgG
MIDSLYIGASGMQAQQLSVDTIANNLANVNTPGFKRNRVSFQDLLYREVARANGLPGSTGNVFRSGVGVGVAGTSKVFTEGDIKKTDNPLDIAIRGQGFMEVLTPEGNSAYTRSASLKVNKDGYLVTLDGLALKASLRIPTEAKEIEVTPAGLVIAKLGAKLDPLEVGQIELVNFMNPAGLAATGDNLYNATEQSGQANYAKPGEDGFGTLAQGFQEASNVKLVEEMVNLMVAQRAYEVSAKVVQISDELMGMSNNLRR